MNGEELLDVYKSMKIKEQKKFHDLYLAYKEKELENEYEKLEMLNQRLRVIHSLQSIYNTDGTPYLDINWVMKHILNFTDEEIEAAKAKK
jgi:hypothetical protein